MNERHRVILIRPWDMSDGEGAGCCGGGSTKVLCTTPEHHQAHTGFGARDHLAPFARAYRALRDALPEGVDLEVVDPRNHLFLIPTLVADSRRRGEGWLGALGAALRGPAYAAIIVDGVTASSGDVPSPDEAVQLVRDALGWPAGNDPVPRT